MEKVRAAATVPWQEAVDFAAEAFAATGVPEADARRPAWRWSTPTCTERSRMA